MIDKMFSQQTVVATFGESEYGVETHVDKEGRCFVPKTIDYKELLGKRVIAFTFGYEDQYYMDEFVFSGIKERYKFFNEQSQPKNEEEKKKLVEQYGYVVVDENGDNTCIFCDCYTDGIFCCSDSDRHSHFFVLE